MAVASSTAHDTLAGKSTDAGVISGGHLVARALKNEGIRIVDVRHEQVAAHAADGYARQTGKLGCVVTTAGPGCTSAVSGRIGNLNPQSVVSKK